MSPTGGGQSPTIKSGHQDALESLSPSRNNEVKLFFRAAQQRSATFRAGVIRGSAFGVAVGGPCPMSEQNKRRAGLPRRAFHVCGIR